MTTLNSILIPFYTIILVSYKLYVPHKWFKLYTYNICAIGHSGGYERQLLRTCQLKERRGK